ncbi:glycosyltransferase [Chitinophagaceae bacterium MMS25-I14]
MAVPKHKQILIAPLDWGLGHTTRCIPIIRHLQAQGHKVVVAGNSTQLDFLEETFPGIPNLYIEGYNVHYSRHASGFLLTLLSQIPRLLLTIKREHDWLLRTVQEHEFDGIISDNRYGLYHDTIPSVIITHQLQVQTGMGNFADQLMRQQHYSYLQRFHECWIPDIPGNINLSGTLAHPGQLPKSSRYIGLLSQMQEQPIPGGEPHLLILLSGPEPQRGMLSDILWEQVQQYNGPVSFVEGTNSFQQPRTDIPEHIQYFHRLTRQELQPLIAGASLVICRSGYSSLMDLAVLNKKAILIPTPGQTEQEYLARHLHDQGVWYSQVQKNFDLKEALTAAETFPFKNLLPEASHHQYSAALDEWTAKL